MSALQYEYHLARHVRTPQGLQSCHRAQVCTERRINGLIIRYTRLQIETAAAHNPTVHTWLNRFLGSFSSLSFISQ